MSAQDRPDVSELLEIVAETLRDNVVPATAPHARHQARVAANLVAIIGRELAQPPASSVPVRKLELLLNLGPGLIGTEAISGALRSCHDDVAAQAVAIVAELVRQKLDVAKPGYDAHDAASEAAIVA